MLELHFDEIDLNGEPQLVATVVDGDRCISLPERLAFELREVLRNPH